MLMFLCSFAILLSLPAGTVSPLPTLAEGSRTLVRQGTEAGKRAPLPAQLNIRYLYA